MIDIPEELVKHQHKCLKWSKTSAGIAKTLRISEMKEMASLLNFSRRVRGTMRSAPAKLPTISVKSSDPGGTLLWERPSVLKYLTPSRFRGRLTTRSTVNSLKLKIFYFFLTYIIRMFQIFRDMTFDLWQSMSRSNRGSKLFIKYLDFDWSIDTRHVLILTCFRATLLYMYFGGHLGITVWRTN